MNIGELTAYLGIDTKDFDKGIKKSTSSLFTFKKAIATLGLGVLAYKLNSASKYWENLYKKQEQSEAALKQVMISMRRFSDESYNNILNLSKLTQANTTFGDEAVLAGTKMLYTFKDITDDLMPRTIKAMTDLSALTGRDLVSSANLLGRASMGLTGELRRVGITVDRVVYEEKGFLGLLEQIEKQVSGQAATLARTKSGGMQQYLNLVNDLRERLGELTLNIKMEFVPHLLKIVTAISNWFDKQKKLQELNLPNWFDTITNSAKKLASVLSIIGNNISKIATFGKTVLSGTPLGLLGQWSWAFAKNRGWIQRSDKETALKDFLEKQRNLQQNMPVISAFPDFTFGPTGYYNMIANTHKVAERQKTIFEKMNEEIQNWGNTFGDMLNDILWKSDTTFKDILRSFGQMITRMIIQTQLIEPLFGPKGFMTSLVSNVFSGIFGGAGGGFGTATIGGQTFGYAPGFAYANGGIINRPTVFPMANGNIGLAGEQGTEGILPLKRNASGDLGVISQNGMPANLNVTIYAMDSKSINDTMKREPNAIIAPLIDQLKGGNRSLLSTLRETL